MRDVLRFFAAGANLMVEMHGLVGDMRETLELVREWLKDQLPGYG